MGSDSEYEELFSFHLCMVLQCECQLSYPCENQPAFFPLSIFISTVRPLNDGQHTQIFTYNLFLPLNIMIKYKKPTSELIIS